MTTPPYHCHTHLGAEGFTSDSDQEEVRKIERQLKSRFPIGSQVSEQRVIQDFSKQNYSERGIMTVIHIMLRRGELQHRLQRKVLFRVRWRYWRDIDVNMSCLLYSVSLLRLCHLDYNYGYLISRHVSTSRMVITYIIVAGQQVSI